MIYVCSEWIKSPLGSLSQEGLMRFSAYGGRAPAWGYDSFRGEKLLILERENCIVR